MSCHVCSSANEADFNAEIMIHFSDRRHLDNPGVLAFVPMFICLRCGSATFKVAENELTLLKEGLGVA